CPRNQRLNRPAPIRTETASATACASGREGEAALAAVVAGGDASGRVASRGGPDEVPVQFWIAINIFHSAVTPARGKVGCVKKLGKQRGAIGRVTRARYARRNRATWRNLARLGARAKVAPTESDLREKEVKCDYVDHAASQTSRRSYSTNPCRA